MVFKDNYPKAPRLKLDFNADPAPNIDIDIEMEQDETCTWEREICLDGKTSIETV
eukprot:Pgem_evm3s19760